MGTNGEITWVRIARDIGHSRFAGLGVFKKCEEVSHERRRYQNTDFHQNILFATDFSPAEGAALPYVLGLAQRYGARVHALHARHPSPYPISGPKAMVQIMETLEEQDKLDSESMQEMLAGVPHEVLSTEGDLWPNIAEILEESKIDLAVNGTRGRTGIGRAGRGYWSIRRG